MSIILLATAYAWDSVTGAYVASSEHLQAIPPLAILVSVFKAGPDPPTQVFQGDGGGPVLNTSKPFLP